MKKFLLLFFVFNAHCIDSKNYSFSYQFQLKDEITFNFTKSYSVELGSVILTNTEDQSKKFRYKYDSPEGYFFNRKTNLIKHLDFVPHHTGKEIADSLFWGILGSATFYTPVPPKSSLKLSIHLNLNNNPRPREFVTYIKQNHKNLEFHVFHPDRYIFSWTEPQKNPPNHIVSRIQVISH